MKNMVSHLCPITWSLEETFKIFVGRLPLIPCMEGRHSLFGKLSIRCFLPVCHGDERCLGKKVSSRTTLCCFSFSILKRFALSLDLSKLSQNWTHILPDQFPFLNFKPFVRRLPLPLLLLYMHRSPPGKNSSPAFKPPSFEDPLSM